MKSKQQLTRAIARALFAVTLLVISPTLFAQVKIGSNPTVIGTTNNLEVEASTTGRKTSVDKVTGQVTIKDGTEGVGKVLTSDAAGGASWQSNAVLRIPETVWIGEQSGSASITTFNFTHNAPKDRIGFVARAGSLQGYDGSTKLYTIQESGYYRLHAGLRAAGSLPLGSNPSDQISVYIGFNGGAGVFHSYGGISSGNIPYLSVFWEGYLNAGETYNVYVYNGSYTVPAQTYTVDKAFLSVTKLF